MIDKILRYILFKLADYLWVGLYKSIYSKYEKIKINDFYSLDLVATKPLYKELSQEWLLIYYSKEYNNYYILLEDWELISSKEIELVDNFNNNLKKDFYDLENTNKQLEQKKAEMENLIKKSVDLSKKLADVSNKYILDNFKN